MFTLHLQMFTLPPQRYVVIIIETKNTLQIHLYISQTVSLKLRTDVKTISHSIISSDNKVYTYMYSYHILFHTAIYLINCKLIEEIDYYLMYSHPTGMNLVD